MRTEHMGIQACATSSPGVPCFTLPDTPPPKHTRRPCCCCPCTRAQVMDIKAPVFRALLHFVYTDTLPEEHEGPNLDVPMAQHLLVAADQYQLTRLRRYRQGGARASVCVCVEVT